MSEALTAAREAYRRCDWHGARDGFTAAAAAGGLSADDAFALSYAAWWLGRVDESLAAGEQAYRLYLEGERPARAAMAAIHIAIDLLLRGDDVIGSGWIRRAGRLLRDQPDSVEHGYLRYLLEVEAALGGPDLDPVIASAETVRELGRVHDDPNLVALGILGQGRALVKQARTVEGLALLDEAMVAVLTEELRPEWAGNIYCHLMSACHELGDIRRAVAWTEATTRWLETLPEAVLFTGICRVHRSQVLQASGGWEQAEHEAQRVCQDLEHMHVASAGEAHYQRGELRRLQGDLTGADQAYECARERGREPQPGLALLQLARGRLGAASAAIRTALACELDPLARARLCAAQVEIALAEGDHDLAEVACTEVEATAAAFGSSGLTATAEAVRGAVLTAGRQPEQALASLRSACRRWRRLGCPYEAAKVGVSLAKACVQLGDLDGAARELDAAAQVFDRLGAVVDADQVAALRGRTRTADGLTARELEVLTEVAAGKTNREIATSLVISEKTVARHLSNIFLKLECSSRTAAAAYAFEHGLASPPHG
jgi:ATP/maltotriose-dependent transcriptional regulator MalT